MTHLILDGSDLDLWPRHHSGGHLIPPHKRPTVLQADRERAERECLRLAQMHNGLFVLFAPVAMAKRVGEVTHVNIRGQELRRRSVYRLLTIDAGGATDDADVPF